MQQEGVRAKSRAIRILTIAMIPLSNYLLGFTQEPPQRSFNKYIADVAILVTIQHILPS